jgi:hypothetical protein
MDSLGVDVHVLSTWVGLYNYDLPLEVGAATAKDCNNYGELKRAMTQLGLKGAMINDHINGHTLKHLLKGSDFS